jgi:antirestriction protein
LGRDSFRIVKSQLIKVTPELILAVISGGAGAFAGLSRALSNFNKAIERRFEAIESDLDNFQDRVIKEYVLKEDFLREMQAVHTKLDRILDHILNHPH